MNEIWVGRHHFPGSSEYSTIPREVVLKSDYDALVAEVEQLRTARQSVNEIALRNAEQFAHSQDREQRLQEALRRVVKADDSKRRANESGQHAHPVSTWIPLDEAIAAARAALDQQEEA